MQIWGFPLELFGAIVVFSLRLERREHYVARMIASVVGATGIIALLQLCVNLGSEKLGLDKVEESKLHFLINGQIIFTVFFAVIVVTFFLILLYLPYQIPLKEAVYCVACAYLAEHIAYCIRLGCNYFWGAGAAESGSVWYPIIHVAVYIVSYHVFAKKMIRNGHYDANAMQSVGLLLATVFLVLVMSMVATIYGFEPIHALYALFACIFVLYSQLKQQRLINVQKELAMQEQLWMKQKAQYEMSKETIDIINTKCHDLKHQVAALRTMSNLEAQQKAIDSISDSVMIYDSIVKTGNEILDTVLTEKSLLCKKKAITLSCIADGQLMNFMDPIDLYTLLGNAIDNAIEGVTNLSEDMRVISLSITERQGMTLIQVENPYAGTIRMKAGIPVTSKEDLNYHGFGVHSMVQIVERYHGFVKIETENQVFVLRMSFTS